VRLAGISPKANFGLEVFLPMWLLDLSILVVRALALLRQSLQPQTKPVSSSGFLIPCLKIGPESSEGIIQPICI
jgi:hypothetical protein